ncbi:hypothetical protein [Thalassotalea fusca]
MSYKKLRDECRRQTQQFSQLVELQYQSQIQAIKNRHTERVTRNDKRPVDISLTSFGDRVETVHYTIASLLAQEVEHNLPFRLGTVTLWLAEEEYRDKLLPAELQTLTVLGLSIQYCPDTKSYKKLLPMLSYNADAMVMTVDDDVIYPCDHLNRLLTKHLEFPSSVVCHYARYINVKKGVVRPYNEWPTFHQLISSREKVDKSAKRLFPVGVGGILYPANVLHKDVLNENLYRQLCPNTDDIWFKIQALRNGVGTVLVDKPTPYEHFVQIPNSQASALWHTNKQRNDVELANVLNYYRKKNENIVEQILS